MAPGMFSRPAKYDLEHNVAACSYALTPKYQEDAMNVRTNPAALPTTLTRRQAGACIAMVFCGLASDCSAFAQPAPQTMEEKPANAANRTRTSLHEEIDLKSDPQHVYEVLLDAKLFKAFTGAPAEIDPKPGGAFSMFGGQIVGRNVDLVPNQRIVQAWRPTHWAPGVYSIVEFELKPKGSGTLVILDHKGFPEGDFDHLEWGWHTHYWEPLKKYFS
jgi:activator of HSP90 ATPase